MVDAAPIVPSAADPALGLGRVGRLAEPTTLGRLARHLAGILPPTASGVRAAGDYDDPVATVAVCGGAGDSLLSPSVTRRVIDRMAQQPIPELAGQAKLDELTPREREVLELVARGLSNREIATALVVEESTIRSHTKRILEKLGLRDRVQIVIFAYETGVNQPAEAHPAP